MNISLLCGLIPQFSISSVLDVGCGTGRALTYLSKALPTLRLQGVEPVPELRQMAISSGLPASMILPGDALALEQNNASVDCVTAFAVLHHIPYPERAIAEMFRVSRHAVFLSDHNIYGVGSSLTRGLKQLFRDLGMKAPLRALLTRGKGYHDTDWDGIFYPFSMIDLLPYIHSMARKFYIFPTKNAANNIYRQASHLAVFALL